MFYTCGLLKHVQGFVNQERVSTKYDILVWDILTKNIENIKSLFFYSIWLFFDLVYIDKKGKQ